MRNNKKIVLAKIKKEITTNGTYDIKQRCIRIEPRGC